jgi:predicted RNA-binding Zn-ribbon protein involved in translation (DUF1610 family)
MAEGRRFVCDSCRKAIEAWSDGNPYYLDERGRKRYAYHPDQKFALCVGNDDPHLCLSCGRGFKVDSRIPVSRCPKCSGIDIASTWNLDQKACPFCRKGRFTIDPEFFAVS